MLASGYHFVGRGQQGDDQRRWDLQGARGGGFSMSGCGRPFSGSVRKGTHRVISQIGLAEVKKKCHLGSQVMLAEEGTSQSDVSQIGVVQYIFLA